MYGNNGGWIQSALEQGDFSYYYTWERDGFQVNPQRVGAEAIVLNIEQEPIGIVVSDKSHLE